MSIATAADQTISDKSHHRAPVSHFESAGNVSGGFNFFYWGSRKSEASVKLEPLVSAHFEEEIPDSLVGSDFDAVVIDWAEKNLCCLRKLREIPELKKLPALVILPHANSLQVDEKSINTVEFLFDGAESSEIEFRLEQLVRRGISRKHTDDSLDDYKQKLVEAIAHDVRSPLHTVSFALDLVLESAEKEESRFVSMLHASKEATGKITDLLDMMVNIQRLEEADGSLSVSEVDLSAIIEEVIHLAGDPENVFNTVPTGTMILADPQLTVRSLSKIVTNSLRYVPVDIGKVDISAEMDEGKVVVSIYENAKTIPTAFLEDAFEMFARVPDEDGKLGRSFGLNFAYSRAALQGQGVRLTATSFPEGNVFQATFAIPA